MFNPEIVNYTMRQKRTEALQRHIHDFAGEHVETYLMCPKNGIPFECRDQFMFFVFSVVVMRDETISQARKDNLTAACQRALFRIEQSWSCPPAERLCSPEYIHEVLWAMIHYLDGCNIILSHTGHLSDSDLLTRIFINLIDEPIDEGKCDMPFGAEVFQHFSLLGFDDEGTELYLRYYASERERQFYAEDFGDAMPPMEKPPYNRDKHLPGQGEFRDFQSRQVVH